MTYSLDFRKKVLKIRSKEGLSIEEVAKRFGVGKARVMRWLVELLPQKKRNKHATKIDMEALKKDVETHPDSYQYERAARFNVSKTGIRSALIRLKLSYKKTWNHPKADEEKRCSFQKRIASYQEEGRPLIYLDESGFAHNMPRTQGYSLKGMRCYGLRAWGECGRINVIGALL